MAAIKHCKAIRKTKSYWLKSREKQYKNEILLEAYCSNCNRFILETVPVLLGGLLGGQTRIKTDKHAEWIARTDIRNATDPNFVGGLDLDLDSSQWKSLRNGVHWVEGSQSQWPYLKIRTRV